MINLLPKKEETDKVNIIKHWLVLGSSVTLAIYLIIVAGTLGYWTYLSFQDTALTSEVATLSTQINKFASLEATVRQIDARQKSIDKILKTRKVFSKTLAKINTRPSGVTVLGWNADTISVTGSDLARIEEYASLLKKNFDSVTVESLSQKMDASIIIKNEKL